MEFVNLTPFAALAYTAIDIKDQEYRVVAIAVNYRLLPDPQRPGHWLPEVIDEDSPPLCMADEAFGELNQSSTRIESDLAPFKPRCDINVLGSAHAPHGKPTRRFNIGLHVLVPASSVSAPGALPEPPQPLNPFMPVSDSAMGQWQRDVAKAQARVRTQAARVLVDKQLAITGPRYFKKKLLPIRLLQTLIKWGSLGLVQPNPWKLTGPAKVLSLPLRYENAWGGQCRLNRSDNSHLAASQPQQAKQLGKPTRFGQRVPGKYQLTPEQLTQHPDIEGPAARLPIAHGTSETNPLGCGYAEDWFLNATRFNTIPAPQIEHPGAPIDASHFWQAARRKHRNKTPAALAPAGLGLVGRAWTPRRQLAGTYDQTWLDQRWPLLPPDFDFGYWNAAPRDQQTDYLVGHEQLTLSNLVAHDTPGASRDAHGNSRMQFTLPGHRSYVLAHFETGGLFPLRAVIDTLTLDTEHPDGPRVTCLWRTLVPATLPITKLEARFEIDPDAPLIKIAEEETT